MIERSEIHGTVIQYLFNNYFRKRYFSKAEGGRPKADRTKHVSGLQRESIFRSTLLSGYLGKSRHLPKYRIVICIAYWISDTENHGLDIIQECNADQKLGRLTLFSLSQALWSYHQKTLTLHQADFFCGAGADIAIQSKNFAFSNCSLNKSASLGKVVSKWMIQCPMGLWKLSSLKIKTFKCIGAVQTLKDINTAKF